ncbi:MAG: hypothetical protein V4676_01675 [Bacteroidota bacterium]
MTQSAGKMFPGVERGKLENETFRRLSTFDFADYKQPHKEAVNSFYGLNEDTIAPGRKITYPVKEDSLVVFIPVAGIIDYVDSENRISLLQCGEVQSFSLQEGNSFTITNPFENELVSYLHLWFTFPFYAGRKDDTLEYSLGKDKNNLTELITQAANESFVRIALGKFEGRKETEWLLTNNNHTAFAFVLQGAFEIENRLLEEKDGLALWNTKGLELEALSEDAIILLVEFN